MSAPEPALLPPLVAPDVHVVPEPALVHLQMPIDVRSVSLALLAVLGVVFALHWASAVFIPLAPGLISSYALAPIVDRLQQLHVPRAIGAALLIGG